MKIKLALFLSLAVVYLGCEKANYPVNDTINIGLGKVYHYDPDMSIKFDSVIEDSRCPAGAECIWAGMAELQFALSVGTQSRDFILYTHTGFRQDTTIFSYKIGIVALKPYPDMSTEFKKESYVVTLRIQK